MKKFQLLSEFWMFFRQNKKYWLLPMILVLLMMSFLMVFAESSALAPFIYSIF